MSEHTPGPWELAWNVHGREDTALIRLNGSSLYAVADVTDLDYPTGKPRYCLADLQLMAAAPELLDALKACRKQLAEWADAGSLDDSDFHAVKAADTAIAKAEGRVE